MVELRLDEIAAKINGRILQGDPFALFRSFNIDSRLSEPGELFFAIVAKRNGHEFVPDAFRRGAGGAVVSQDVPPPGREFALVRVADTVAALQALGRSALLDHPVKVIGITGSVGKTTTKEFAASLLARRHSVLKSEGNFNNYLGLALSLLKLRPDHEVAVLEMGTSGFGELRNLTWIAPPDVAVIININPVHLEFFRSPEGIALAKKEILEGAKETAVAVLNGDDVLIQKIAASWRGRRILFGRKPNFDIQASAVRKLGTKGLVVDLRLEARRERVQLPFLYEEYLENLLAAVGAGHALSLPFDVMVDEIPHLTPFSRRGELIRLARGVHVVDDSYNSNPRALQAALQGLASLPAKRKVAVLGDMLELGEREAEFHRRAGRQAAANGWDLLLTVGPLARLIAEEAVAAGLPSSQVQAFDTVEEAAAAVPALIHDGDLVLVKGSRGVKTERVVEKLKEKWRED
ncbi:MAG: UDP-N-acetylmuramoyl-tripeptide--D-alanyl-D-alanine ligase [Acidobacteriota bacterium]